MAKKDYKTLKVGLNMSDHDWAHRLKQAYKFTEKGLKIKFQLMLKGRTKYMFKHDEVTADLKKKLIDSGLKVINAWNKNNNVYAFVQGFNKKYKEIKAQEEAEAL